LQKFPSLTGAAENQAQKLKAFSFVPLGLAFLVCFPAVETAGYSHSSLRDKRRRSGFSAESHFCFLKNAAVCRRAATKFSVERNFPNLNKWNLFTAAVFDLKKL